MPTNNFKNLISKAASKVVGPKTYRPEISLPSGEPYKLHLICNYCRAEKEVKPGNPVTNVGSCAERQKRKNVPYKVSHAWLIAGAYFGNKDDNNYIPIPRPMQMPYDPIKYKKDGPLYRNIEITL